jgi:hypothetical protein
VYASSAPIAGSSWTHEFGCVLARFSSWISGGGPKRMRPRPGSVRGRDRLLVVTAPEQLVEPAVLADQPPAPGVVVQPRREHQHDGDRDRRVHQVLEPHLRHVLAHDQPDQRRTPRSTAGSAGGTPWRSPPTAPASHASRVLPSWTSAAAVRSRTAGTPRTGSRSACSRSARSADNRRSSDAERVRQPGRDVTSSAMRSRRSSTIDRAHQRVQHADRDVVVLAEDRLEQRQQEVGPVREERVVLVRLAEVRRPSGRRGSCSRACPRRW